MQLPLPAPAASGAECITLGSTARGRWLYSTVELYRAGARPDGTRIWKRDRVIAQYRSPAKARRVAELEAYCRGCEFTAARHGQEIQG